MSDKIQPVFSVVTCCYNQGPYLKDCIESVLNQQYPNFEHIVVDDGSKDNTREVATSYKHVRYIYQQNAGQSAALNRGFQEAKGDIIAWVNSDDYYSPQAFHRIARELDPARGRWIVAGAAKVVNAEGHPMWLLKNGNVGFFRLLYHPKIYPYNGWTVMPCQPSVFFHRKVYEKLGPLDTSLKYGMDYEYWLRAMTQGYGFHYVPQIFSNYRYHATSHSNQGFDTFLGEWQRISDAYFAKLSGADRLLARLWWAYARIECLLVRQHKAAIQHIARRFGHAPEQHPLSLRMLVILRAMLTAPWIPMTLAWRAMNKELQEPPLPAGQQTISQ
jgi:glycosyltransferase involved in cell wall biosynthesis